MKHTPGPWQYRRANNYEGFAIFPVATLPSLASCERFGEKMTIDCFNFPGQTEANARLIAAAPDLLEALQGMERIKDLWLPIFTDAGHEAEAVALHEARKKILAAIAKVEGNNR